MTIECCMLQYVWLRPADLAALPVLEASACLAAQLC